MSWNYRIIAHENPTETILAIHEVYYDENGNPNGYRDGYAEVVCDEIEGVDAIPCIIEMMRLAIDKPILCGGKDFPKEYELKKDNK